MDLALSWNPVFSRDRHSEGSISSYNLTGWCQRCRCEVSLLSCESCVPHETADCGKFDTAYSFDGVPQIDGGVCRNLIILSGGSIKLDVVLSDEFNIVSRHIDRATEGQKTLIFDTVGS